jgi:hypothetical protein
MTKFKVETKLKFIVEAETKEKAVELANLVIRTTDIPSHWVIEEVRG